MKHYIHHYKKRKNILPLIGLIILLLIFVWTGKYVFSYLMSPDTTAVATTTPKVVKPKKTGPHISVSPDKIVQGEPALITVEGLSSTTTVRSFTLGGRPLVTFIHEGKISALLGVDLHSTSGKFPLVLTLGDGKELRGEIVVGERVVVKMPFDIPESLGGNTPESVNTLFYTLAQEAKIVNALPTNYKKLWTDKFRYPLNGAIDIQDPYGYTRITGNSTMAHKGVDLEAPIGTPVYAMNKGDVVFTDTLRNYGKTVIIDHGAGLQTVYMHLSEINVTVGQMVEKGDLIAKTGDTGYVLGPHLHLTVRIWDISIDPIKFLELLGE